jgi:hypothetical protein
MTLVSQARTTRRSSSCRSSTLSSNHPLRSAATLSRYPPQSGYRKGQDELGRGGFAHGRAVLGTEGEDHRHLDRCDDSGVGARGMGEPAVDRGRSSGDDVGQNLLAGEIEDDGSEV